ncbi:transmembrane protein 18 [Esox lucius]|uniref:Transmembrane protein 18 n=1 Tax=Esox lucius TaxID=8010 RepID=C1BWZ6_ESOLU|nr:transmembrane protein 18 [Esox lucius]ACO13549.1 Transmembrane protein 18 [Esox lucius]
MTDQKQQNISSVPIDGFSNLRITSIWTFLMSIQWSESWLIGLLVFHAVCLLTTLLTSRFYRVQICQFLVMVCMVYSAEYLNEVAAKNWRVFSRFQYFDSNGMFISLVYSVPLLLNTIIIVALWVYRTFSTMTELKVLQLKRKARREQNKKTD